ncbi:hypothetical protein [Dendronalium sp. ChiSLP03b]|uniref:hypothetical protein n=1 Tax=Dendronalium sp. ChiSLP03b TaxID=3075381 RepID=UPI00391BC69E
MRAALSARRLKVNQSHRSLMKLSATSGGSSANSPKKVLSIELIRWGGKNFPIGTIMPLENSQVTETLLW